MNLAPETGCSCGLPAIGGAPNEESPLHESLLAVLAEGAAERVDEPPFDRTEDRRPLLPVSGEFIGHGLLPFVIDIRSEVRRR
jgi:hypothetical protein